MHPFRILFNPYARLYTLRFLLDTIATIVIFSINLTSGWDPLFIAVIAVCFFILVHHLTVVPAIWNAGTGVPQELKSLMMAGLPLPFVSAFLTCSSRTLDIRATAWLLTRGTHFDVSYSARAYRQPLSNLSSAPSSQRTPLLRLRAIVDVREKDMER
ncbi:hypothetical protein FB451DRAFT_1408655 [Mycena latifolia]|nr:hypothetical protein FB451DRAFT_1408655 [Mycena latifolia]